VNFIHPIEVELRDVFRYAHRNATILTSLRIRKQATVVRIARPEDATLCKLAVNREKDLKGLELIVPKFKELSRLGWKYLGGLAKRFGSEKEVAALKRKF